MRRWIGLFLIAATALAPSQVVGPVLQRLPARALGLLASTGGAHLVRGRGHDARAYGGPR